MIQPSLVSSVIFKLMIVVFLSGCGLQQKVVSTVTEIKTDGQMLHDKLILRKVNKQIKKGNLSSAETLLSEFSLDSYRYVAEIKIFNKKYKRDSTVSLQEIEDVKRDIRNIIDPYQRSLALLEVLTFYLDNSIDIPEAKQIANEVWRTIGFIHWQSRRLERQRQLMNIKKKHNHLLTKNEGGDLDFLERLMILTR